MQFFGCLHGRRHDKLCALQVRQRSVRNDLQLRFGVHDRQLLFRIPLCEQKD